MSETIFSSAANAVFYKLLNADIRSYPFPHFFIEGLFPEDAYGEILANLPSDADFTAIEDTSRVIRNDGKKSDRYVIPLREDSMQKFPAHSRDFWREFTGFINGQDFARVLMAKYTPYLNQRFGAALGQTDFHPDALLIRDKSDYLLGPHTDTPRRVIVFLLYLPQTAEHEDLGTSIYVPKDPNFTCEGGPHHHFSQFNKVFTAPYRPNSCLCFFKTINSFHGVDPIPYDDATRNLVHYFIAEETS